MDAAFDSLRLDSQLCFPLYACTRKTISRYRPFLEEIGLTYTQYLVMMVMWEHEEVTSRKMGTLLRLDSGTLTPVLRSLEEKGLLQRARGEDKRNLNLTITQAGRDLKSRALSVPQQMSECFPLNQSEASQLRILLDKLLKGID